MQGGMAACQEAPQTGAGSSAEADVCSGRRYVELSGSVKAGILQTSATFSLERTIRTPNKASTLLMQMTKVLSISSWETYPSYVTLEKMELILSV